VTPPNVVGSQNLPQIGGTLAKSCSPIRKKTRETPHAAHLGAGLLWYGITGTFSRLRCDNLVVFVALSIGKVFPPFSNSTNPAIQDPNPTNGFIPINDEIP